VTASCYTVQAADQCESSVQVETVTALMTLIFGSSVFVIYRQPSVLMTRSRNCVRNICVRSVKTGYVVTPAGGQQS
jgi:hypothetical protein